MALFATFPRGGAEGVGVAIGGARTGGCGDQGPFVCNMLGIFGIAVEVVVRMHDVTSHLLQSGLCQKQSHACMSGSS